MTNSPDPVSPWARWLMPSMEDLLFLLLLLWLIGSHGTGLMSDADTGTHIRTGEYILNHVTIPRADIFSYTKEGRPWIVHSWLSAVLFAVVHRAIGLSGVALFSALIISFTYVLLFRLLIRRQVDLFTTVILVVIVTSVSYPSWVARPLIFSTLLALIWYDRLDCYARDGKKGRLFLLPFLMVIWVNLHGGYLTGIILLLIFLAGEVMSLVFTQSEMEKAQARLKIRSLSIVTVACLAAALVNPYGYEILLFPFRLLSNSFLQQRITEWRSPNFHLFPFLPFELALLLLIVSLGRSQKKTNFTDMGLILVWSHAALYSARHIPIFAVVTALVMGSRLAMGSDSAVRPPSLLRLYRAHSLRIGTMNQAFNKHLIAFMIVLFTLGSAIVQKPSGVLGASQGRFDPKSLPVQAATFIKKVGLPGHMFNHSVFGGYLIYALYPDYKVFTDGRIDMYGNAFMKEYGLIHDLNARWREVLDQYQVNWIICHTDDPLATLLSAARDWKPIYSDETASIFIRDVPENQPLIQRFPDVTLAPRPDVNSS